MILRIIQLIGLIIFIFSGITYLNLYGIDQIAYSSKNQALTSTVAISFVVFLAARIMRWVKADLK